MRRDGFLRHWLELSPYRDFGKLLLGDALSGLGSSVTAVALPLTAVLLLHATPFEMGILGAVAVVPHLVLGLPAGVWAERWPYRRTLVVADLTRALLLGAIPVLAAVGALRMWYLYTVVLLAGVGTLFDGVVATSYVPALVERRHLLQANSASTQSGSLVSTTGSAAGGALVQLLTAPIAIAVDAVSFVVSAICKSLIRTPGRPQPASTPRPARRRLYADIAEGLRAVFAHPLLRALILAATLGAIAGQVQNVVLVLFLARDLGLPPSVVGIAMAVSSVAAIGGAFVASPITERLGHGPTFVLGQLTVAVAGLALAATAGPAGLIVVILVLAQLLRGAGPPLYSVNQVTVRQSLVPAELMTRVNATWRFLVFGAQPLGALLGGVLGSAIGLRGTIVVGSVGMLVAVGLVIASPLRTLRELPAT